MGEREKRTTLAAYQKSDVYHRVLTSDCTPLVKYSLCRCLHANVRDLDIGQRAKSNRRKCSRCFPRP